MRRFMLSVGMLALTVLAAAVAPALAKPRLDQVHVRYGVVDEQSGAGCAPATITRSIKGDDPVTFQPAVGDDVGYVDSVVVTAATLVAGTAAWTVHPTADECALYEGDPSWTWVTDEIAWGVTHRTSAYTVRASQHGGIQSIGGLRVNRVTRAPAPTIRKARRRFGRPSSVRRRYGIGCRARWTRIGLTIDFINLGGRNPCRHGFVQAGFVKGPAAADWTALVARDPGIALGTTGEFLEAEFIGEPGETARTWTLAHVFIPYGDAGYYPSLSAFLNRRGAVRGFEFWVGAGGD